MKLIQWDSRKNKAKEQQRERERDTHNNNNNEKKIQKENMETEMDIQFRGERERKVVWDWEGWAEEKRPWVRMKRCVELEERERERGWRFLNFNIYLL